MDTKLQMKDLLAQCNVKNSGELMAKYRIKYRGGGDGESYSIKGNSFSSLEDAASYIIENGLTIKNMESSNSKSNGTESFFALSTLIVSAHGLLIEISLWLSLLLAVAFGFYMWGVGGAVVGLILWFIFTVFLVGPLLILQDIRKFVKRIEENLTKSTKSSNE